MTERKNRFRRTLTVFLAATWLFIPRSTATGKPTASPARVVSVQGTGAIRPAGRLKWVELAPGEELRPGDHIKTGDESTATIDLGDQAKLKVGGASYLQILDSPGRGKTGQAAIKNLHGTVLVISRNEHRGNGDLFIVARTDTVVTGKGILTVTVRGDGTLELCLVDGSVTVRRPGSRRATRFEAPARISRRTGESEFKAVQLPREDSLGVSRWAGGGAPWHPSSSTVREIRPMRVDSPITVDGKLDEPAWQRPGVSGFIQQDPHEGKPASERTEVWVAYDRDKLYVAARLFDKAPGSISRRLCRRDSRVTAKWYRHQSGGNYSFLINLLDSDWFEFHVDPYHDHVSGFWFAVNPAGSICDGTLYSDNRRSSTWDGVWDAAAKIDDKGWTVEMAIPFSQLRFSRRQSSTWGVNFCRIIKRKNESDFLVMVPKNESGWVSHFAELKDMEITKRHRQLEFTPYVVNRTRRGPVKEGDPFAGNTNFNYDMGLDLKYGLHSNLILDGTINPDFGQVEVDPAVVNLTAYETRYPEKRSFFVSGSDAFRFGRSRATRLGHTNWFNPNFFYSRRIGRRPHRKPDYDGFVDNPDKTTILGAAKLTGKNDKGLSMGIFTALTDRELARIDTSGTRFEEEVEPLTLYNVIRMQKEYDSGRRSIGFINTNVVRRTTSRHLLEELPGYANAIGVDGWNFFGSNRTWILSGWLGLTRVSGDRAAILKIQRNPQHYFQRPDAAHVRVDSTRTSLSGWGGRLILSKEKGSFQFNSSLGVISPGFEINDAGFQLGGETINGHVGFGYQWYKPGRIFRGKNISFTAPRTYDFGGNRLSEHYRVSFGGQLKNYWSFHIALGRFQKAFSNSKTRGGPLTERPGGTMGNLYFNSDSRKPITLDFFGEGYISDLDGSRFAAASGLTLKPNGNFSLKLSPHFKRNRIFAQWVTSVEDELAANTFGNRYVFARLKQTEVSADIRLNLIFTPKLSLQLYLQPLISVGDYYEFKELAKPRTYDFKVYGEGVSTIREEGGSYRVDPDGPGPAEQFEFSDPDFNFKSLRGNAVFRWEYRPGSTIYLVWTQNRTDDSYRSVFRLADELNLLAKAKADNVFLFKVTMWFGA